jgi:hypothetical protein
MDETDLNQTGWGIVFHLNENPAVIAALQSLIKHRREQIGDSKKAILLETEYRPGETYRDWLKRHEVAPVNVKPNKVPFIADNDAAHMPPHHKGQTSEHFASCDWTNACGCLRPGSRFTPSNPPV